MFENHDFKICTIEYYTLETPLSTVLHNYTMYAINPFLKLCSTVDF